MNQRLFYSALAAFLVLSSCDCVSKLAPACGDCQSGYVCDGNECKKGCTSDADCPVHEKCFTGICLCADDTCIADSGAGGGAPAIDSGSPGGGAGGGFIEGGGGGVVDSGSGVVDSGAPGAGTPDAGIPDAGIPDAGAVMCGPTQKLCNGACVDDTTCCNCCYQCDGGNFYLDTAYCTPSQTDGFSDGGCPTGYSSTQVDCRPCWDCRVSNAYCVNENCCGNWPDSGIVGGGCTCYGCSGFAYDFDEETSCANAQAWSHSGGPSPNPNPACIWPSGGNTSFCGYSPRTCDCHLIACGGSCAL